MIRLFNIRILIILLLLNSWLWAQTQNYRENVSKRGTTAASFLEIGVGSRALAMGGAFTALSDDPTAIYWNIGGLAKIKRSGVVFNHTEWIADTRFDFLGAAFKLGRWGTLGFSLTALGMDEMEVTTVEEPEGTGQTFSAGDIAVSLGYAFNLTDRFSLGLNSKVIRQTIWEMHATGFALDVGVHYVTPFPGITLEFAMTNFGTKMRLDGHNTRILYDFVPSSSGNNDRVPAKLETDAWPLPLNFRIGILYKMLTTPDHQLNLEVDAAHPNNDYESVNVGIEYIFLQRVALRGGYKSLFLEDSEVSLTLGAGMNYPIMGNIMLHIDFAYADFGLLENIYKYSIGIDF
ncbi:MAG: hypothetical protein Kow0042_20900 [Calditrichia bacterium]